MTENEALFRIKDLEYECMNSTIHYFTDKDIPMLHIAIKALEEIQQYRAIGTVEEFKVLKEKNTPMELAEHNSQDEPHHYLCPSCRNIVSCNQNYCEECGQALEN